MSKNFELLRQAQREKELLDREFSPAASNGKMFEVLRQANRGQELLNTPSVPVPSHSEPAQPKPNRHSGEETFKLVQRLFLAKRQLAPRMVVFCGVGPEIEHDWICARASEHLASQIPGSVCIVDANLSRRCLHKHFKVDGLKGFCDAIREGTPAQNFVQRIGTENLWFLPAGSSGQDINRRAILMSDRLPALLAELRTEFDYVLISAVPMETNSESCFLAAHTDGVILILEPNYTPLQAARQAKDDLQAANAKVLGVVFNERPLSLPQPLGRLPARWRDKLHKR
jgi:hypothetical protein